MEERHSVLPSQNKQAYLRTHDNPTGLPLPLKLFTVGSLLSSCPWDPYPHRVQFSIYPLMLIGLISTSDPLSSFFWIKLLIDHRTFDLSTCRSVDRLVYLFIYSFIFMATFPSVQPHLLMSDWVITLSRYFFCQ